MKPTQNGGRCDPSSRLADRPTSVFICNECIGDMLIDALMGSGAIEVIDVLLHNAMELMAR